jgi:N-methylhydantoinase B
MNERDAIRAAAAHEIFRISLEGIADRMQDSLLRAACSVVAREGMDCAAALFLPDGRVLAQASSLPLLLGGMIPAVRGLLDVFPADSMQEGDGFLQNDPWSGGTHLPDIIVVRPVRVHDHTVALAATILHHQDVGGLAAGSVPPDAREIFQEGLRIPPVHWRRHGKEDAAVATILTANSRTPDLLRGDLRAQWAAVSLGARDIGGLLRSMGAAAFAQASEALIEHAGQMTEAALGRLRDDDVVVDDALDGDGLSEEPVPLRVTLRKSGGKDKPRLEIDFEGSSPQTTGPVNAAPSGLVAAAFAVMRHLAPAAPPNHGMLAHITLKMPEGSVVNPRFPAAVNARTATVKLACNAMLTAISRLADAGSANASNGAVAVVLSAGGKDAAGRGWFFTEIVASGSGGGPAGPGVSGISTDVSNARNLPAEVLETTAPIRVEAVMRRRGSGGSGLHAGGDGVHRAYRLLEGTAMVSYRGERHTRGASGAQGGGDGAPSAAWIARSTGEIEALASKARFVWNAGDLLVIETAGGGGWHSPSSSLAKGSPTC